MRLLSILTSLVVGALARPQRDTTNDTHSQSNTTLTKHPSVTIANGTVIGNYPPGLIPSTASLPLSLLWVTFA